MGEERSRQASNLQFIRKDAGSLRVMVYVILAVLLLAAQTMFPGYLEPTHVVEILRLVSLMGIAAIEQNLAIPIGGIDLSIADIIAFTNMTAARIMVGWDENPTAAPLATIVMGAIVGFINGVGIHWLKIPPFIMILGVGTVTQGVFLTYTKGTPKSNASPLLETVCNQSPIGTLSGIVVIWTAMAAVIIVPSRNTPYGRKIYPVSTNEQTVRFSGVCIGRVTSFAYLIPVIIVVASGFFLVGYTGISFPGVSISYNIKTIAAVIIGETAITDGKGGYIGTIAGATIVTILDDSLTIVNISEARRQIIQGVIVVLLVPIYSRGKRRK